MYNIHFRHFLLVLLISAGSCSLRAQSTAVPDPAFEQFLIDQGYDEVLDGELLNASVAGITELTVTGITASSLEGIKAFGDLQTLHCFVSGLTVLDVSDMAALEVLQCQNGALTLLDVSGTSIYHLECQGNELSGLDVRGLPITYLICNDNPFLCILVDDPSAMGSATIGKDDNMALTTDCDTVAVPDPAFEQALIDLGEDVVLDGQVLRAKLENLTTLDLSYRNVSNLTGIEYCTNLTSLNVSGSQLTAVDVSPLHHLTEVRCGDSSQLSDFIPGDNPLTFIELYNCNFTAFSLSGHPVPLSIDLDTNPLTSLSFTDCEIDTIWLGISSGLNDAAFPGSTVNQLIVHDMEVSAFSLGELQTKRIWFYNCPVGDYDLSSATQLEYADIGDCNVTSMVTGELPFLESLYLSNNAIADIDLSGLPALTSLDLSYNGLATLDLTHNSALESVYLDANNLVQLDFPGADNLSYVDVSENQLTELDLRDRPTLAGLNVSQNPLQKLLLNGGGNYSDFSADDIPGACIQVDDPDAFIASYESYIDPTATVSTYCGPRTSVPDENFEQALIDLGFDDIIDHLVITETVAAITTLDISWKNIADLTGLQDFTALETLNASGNPISVFSFTGLGALTELNVSGTALTYIDVAGSNLSKLDASGSLLDSFSMAGNTTLKQLEIYGNPMTSLSISDSVVERIYAGSCQLGTALVSGNSITDLYLPENQLTNLDVSQCPALAHLGVSYNQLTSLDLTSLPLLQSVDASYNSLAYFAVSEPNALTHVNVDSNQLTSLQTAVMSDLENLYGASNFFTALDLSAQQQLVGLDFRNNPDLSCIQVTDVAAAEANPDFYKDDTTSFSDDCYNLWTPIPDANFEQALLDAGYDDVIDGRVSTPAISGVTTLFVGNHNIQSLEGIEDFTSLTSLYADHNQLTSFSFTGLDALTELHLAANQLTAIDITGSHLGWLNVSENQITSFEMAGNTTLTTLMLNDNPLDVLSVTDSAVESVYAERCGMDYVTIAGEQVTHLSLVDNELTSIDLSRCPNLETLYIADNSLTLLSLYFNEALIGVDAQRNQLDYFQPSNPNNLEWVELNENQFTWLPVNELPSLTSLHAQANLFESLDLTPMPLLASVWLDQNPDLVCIKVDDVAAAGSNPMFLKDATATYSTNCDQLWTSIPDPAFEQILIDKGYDTVLDGRVPTPVIAAIENLELEGGVIFDLAGINDFASLRRLGLYGHNLPLLDLSPLQQLEELSIGQCQVETLTVGTVENLTSLSVFENPMTSLSIQSAPNLTILRLYSNQLESFDLSGFPLLTSIQIDDNHLTWLDTSMLLSLQTLNASSNELQNVILGNPNLQTLLLNGNALSTIELDSVPNLHLLGLSYNQFTAVDLSPTPWLAGFDISYNQLEALDLSELMTLSGLNVSGNPLQYFTLGDKPGLYSLLCTDTALTQLDVASAPNLFLLAAESNPYLSCIRVSDPEAAAASEYFTKDETASYSENCGYSGCPAAVYANGAWTIGAPDASRHLFIRDDLTISGELTGCQMTIMDGATVTVAADGVVELTSDLIVRDGATAHFENGAVLFQHEAVANTGIITFSRNSNALYPADMTLWSSPLSGSQTLKAFSPLTADTRFYVYNTTLNAYSNYTSASGIFGGLPEEVTFVPGKGYLIRMPDGLPAGQTSVFEGIFEGTPNNGYISTPILDTGNRFNAVGNPYPSPLNVWDFIDGNGDNLDNGTLYFWRKTSNPGASSYAVVTKLAYAANSADGGDVDDSDFVTNSPDQWTIGAGQGFFVKASVNASSLSFEPFMRRKSQVGPFFRSAANADVSCVWLDLTNDAGQFAQTAVGYTDETTTDLDYGWDGRALTDGEVGFWSLSGETKLAIQARGPFDVSDAVPAGYKATAAGNYTVSLARAKGAIAAEDTTVYLVDAVTNTTHNLKSAPYTFTTEAGTFNNRFTIVYENATMGLPEDAKADDIRAYATGGGIVVTGTAELGSVDVFDIRGRQLATRKNISSKTIEITGLNAEEQLLLLKIRTANGAVVTRKIIY